MRKLLSLFIAICFFSKVYSQETPCQLCKSFDDCTDYYGYKVSYDPTTNKICVTSVNEGDCSSCSSNFYFEKCLKFQQNLYKSIPVKEPVFLQIDNLNLLKYKINISSEIIDNGGDIGQLYSLASQLIPSPIGYSTHISPPKVDSGKTNGLDCKFCTTAIDELEKELKSFHKGKELQVAFDGIVKRCSTGNCVVGEIQKKFDDIGNAIKIKIKIDDKIYAIDTIIEDYERIKNLYNQLSNCDRIENISEVRTTLCTDFKTLATHLHCSEIAYSKQCLLSFMGTLKNDFESLKTESPELYAVYLKVGWEATVDPVLKNIDTIAQRAARQLALIRVIGIPSPYRFMIPIVPPEADAVSFTLNISPRSDSLGGGYHVVNQKIVISTRRGWHFDYGLGLLLTWHPNPSYYFGYDSIYARDQSGNILKYKKSGLDSTLATGQKVHTETTPSRVNIGISAQAMILRRLGRFNYFGPTLGIGFTSDLNAAITIGGAYMIGNTHKIALVGGWAATTVRVPSDIYKMNDATGVSSIFLPAGNSDIKYKINMRSNWFIGLSISFGKTNIQSATSANATTSSDTTTSNSGSASKGDDKKDKK